MFIKLTRKYNGGHVWINADRIIAVETGQKGGSVVVPDGEDIDYDVTEDPETVVKLLGVEVKSPEIQAKAVDKKRKNAKPRRRMEDTRGRRPAGKSENKVIQQEDIQNNETVHV
jgi:hypothetical protein